MREPGALVAAVARRQHCFEKADKLLFAPLLGRCRGPTMARRDASLCNLARLEPLEAVIMHPQRSAQVLGLFQIVVVGGWIVAWFAGVESVGIPNTGAALIDDRRLPSLAAAVELVDAPRVTAIAHAAI